VPRIDGRGLAGAGVEGTVAVIRLAVLLMLFAAPAYGQQHEWIRDNPNYLQPDGVTHCCSNVHCRPTRAGEVVRQPDGWLHTPTGTALPDGVRGIYNSEDGQVWVCAYGGKVRCLFLDMRM